MRIIPGLALALLLGWAHLAAAAEPAITATDAWARATGPDTPTGMAFVTLNNGGKDADRLVSAATPAAAKVEFHAHVHADGTMKMQQRQSVDLPAGGDVRFGPGGLHLMLVDLKGPLKAGQNIPLTLTFAKSAPVTVGMAVVAQGAAPPVSQPPAQHMHDPAMHDQNMTDPAYRSMHEEHMKDPDHRAMHEKMHGSK